MDERALNDLGSRIDCGRSFRWPVIRIRLQLFQTAGDFAVQTCFGRILLNLQKYGDSIFRLPRIGQRIGSYNFDNRVALVPVPR